MMLVEFELAKAAYLIGMRIDARVDAEQMAAAKRLEFIHRSMGQRWRWLAQSILEELRK